METAMDAEPTPENLRAWAQTFDDGRNPVPAYVLRRAASRIAALSGTLGYILAQAKANHPGALAVIQATAEMALDPSPVAEAARAHEQSPPASKEG
jgi:hypothetical protein